MRLATLTTILLFGAIFLVGGTVLYGRSHEEPDATPTLDLCNGKPCFAGLIVNVSSWSDAHSRLSKTTSDVNSIELVANSGTLQIVVTRSSPAQNVINLIYLFDVKKESLPSLGQLVERFGEPCGIVLTGDPDQIDVRIYFSNMGANVISSKNGHLRLNSTVRAINLGEFDLQTDQGDITCDTWKRHGITIVPWLGFASINRYISEKPVN